MSLGSPRVLDSGQTGWSGRTTAVPYKLLWNLAVKKGVPLAVTGTNNVTHTFGFSENDGFPFFFGEEFSYIAESSNTAYTWAAGAVNDILDSTGVVTADQSPATGIWYYYLGVTAANTISIYPSQTAPSEGPGTDGTDSGYFTHPGTSKTVPWVYIGFVLCTATTPAFAEFTKVGKSYHFDDDVLTIATAGTSFATALWTGAKALPAHTGVKVSGILETGATAGDATHIAATSSGQGEVRAKTPAAVLMEVPFGPIEITGGNLYYKHTANSGDVTVNTIEDVI